MSRWIQEGDNVDITNERKKGTFDTERMSEWIHGGSDVLKRRREILEFVKTVDDFKDPVPTEFMSREERILNNARKVVAMTNNTDQIDGSDFFGEGMYYQALTMGRDLHAMSLHYVMFIPTLQGQTDDEQLDEWLTKAISRAVVGTYAQTELGHGTNLSKLETTATYDPATEEFVLNSPTITAAKWWPGGLGKSSNYAVVVAQLYTRGECKGPHPFIVQLREDDTHLPLKGIRLGDIGPKLGINGNDNGFLLFDKVRVPRRALLMRYAKVKPDGTYVAPAHSKLGYGTMVFVRSIMIKDQSTQLAAAATIATRYASVRRQGEISPGKGEVQILDYQTQQFRVFPQLARAFAFMAAATEIRDLYMTVTEQLTHGNTELLAELHVLSSGLKSLVSWDTAQGIEQCRLACGGHGYSQASGFPEIYGYAVGGCTYEGENLVMLLQVARFLMRAAESVKKGTAKLADIGAYIGKTGEKTSRLTTHHHYTDADLIHDLEHAARKQIFRAYDRLKKAQQHLGPEDAWNSVSVELAKASRWHVRVYLVKNFLHKVSLAPQDLKFVLIDVARLYAYDIITSSIGSFLEDGYMCSDQMNEIKEGIYECLAKIRPNAVSLVDSWDYDDKELKSVLGRRDGNVYPALLEWAQNSQLNKSEVLQSHTQYLGPMMKDARSKL